MERIVKRDPFFDRQPPLAFLDELKKPLHSTRPEYYGKRPAVSGETDVRGMYLEALYPDDPTGLLETVYADFRLFLEVYGIAGRSYPVRVRRGETECHEAYTVETAESGVTITAADTEGVRRALIFLEDELRRRENAFLVPGKVSRKPYIRSRITRCFFSPINRPPKYGDELSDDVDYYPEEYLNRLMHDGANGVWIYTRFSDLLPSSYIVENGAGYEKRIAKLNRVIEKCARYGIGVYVFAIEPAALTPEQAKKYPELAGTPVWNGVSFCADTDAGRAFCREAGVTLLRLAPKLAGFISITYGERPTSCASAYKSCKCPRCSARKPGEVLANAVEALRSGFREANPAFETVSWTYGHRLWEHDDIHDYVKNAPDDVMLMQNFDDMGYTEQLGETRQCVDYWLSYAGPSELFEITAEQAAESGKHMFAKMQVCCSHEIASVPYVPVPGILWKKYAGAHRLGVEGVMQCWYFGNYPSLMSKAAGELAFTGNFDDENGFLRSLAAVYWGNSRADTVVGAWRAFEAGYSQYPMNVMFSYYGPMHDSVVWKLALKPKNFSLPRSWQTLDPVDGDRIGESLLNGHTLDEAAELAGKMCENWDMGCALLAVLADESEDAREQKSVAEAIRLLFAGGRDILRFYLLRDVLGRRVGDPAETLAEMRRTVVRELEYSRAMLPLCERDGRLGYHSEGEGYKFFPEKLRDRVAQLEELLETEFPEVGERIAAGLSPLEYYEGVEENDKIKRYTLPFGGLDGARWEPVGEDSAFRAAYDRERLYIELKSERQVSFTLCPEFRLLWPDATVILGPDGVVRLGGASFLYYSLFGEREKREYAKYRDIKVIEDSGAHLVLTLTLAELGLDRPRPMKLKLSAGGASWCRESDPVSTLGKSEVSPGDYGWLLPEHPAL